MNDVSRLKQMQSRWSQGGDIIESPSVILSGDGVECVDGNRIYIYVLLYEAEIISVHVSRESAEIEREEWKKGTPASVPSGLHIDQWELVDRVMPQ